MPQFSHKPLTSPQTEIRLLKLCLSGDLDDIRCIITTYPLHSRPAYTALSYEWGDPADKVEILVNGKVFFARHNLWLFLHRMKVAALQKCSTCSQGKTALLWIDALCIDQTVNAERSAQVQLMGSIYRDAREVVVWLGWSEEMSLKAALTASKHFFGQANIGQRSCAEFASSGLCCEFKLEGSNQEATKEEQLNFLREICKKSYWTRRWIVQEIVLAKKVLLVFGEHEVPWDAFCRLFRGHEGTTLGSGSQLINIIHSTAYRVRELQEKLKKNQRIDHIRDMLFSYRQLQCENPFDKVYALAGFAAEENFEIDYSIPASELFRRVLLTSNRAEGSIFEDWHHTAADCGFSISQALDSPPIDSKLALNGRSFPLCVMGMLTVRGLTDWERFKICLRPAAEGFAFGNGRRVDTIQSDAMFIELRDKLNIFANTELTCLFSSSSASLINQNLGECPIDLDRLTVDHKGRPYDFAQEAAQDDSKHSKDPKVFMCEYSSRRRTRAIGITWSEVQDGDMICEIYKNAYLILREDMAKTRIIGTAWVAYYSGDFPNLFDCIDRCPVKDYISAEMWLNETYSQLFPTRDMDIDRSGTAVQLHLDFWELMNLLRLDDELPRHSFHDQSEPQRAIWFNLSSAGIWPSKEPERPPSFVVQWVSSASATMTTKLEADRVKSANSMR